MSPEAHREMCLADSKVFSCLWDLHARTQAWRLGRRIPRLFILPKVLLGAKEFLV